MVLDDSQTAALAALIWMQVWPWLLAGGIVLLILLDWIRLRFFKKNG